MVMDAWRRRHWPGLVVLLGLGGATVALSVSGPLPFPLRPAAYLPIAGVAALAYYFLVPYQQDDWKWKKLRRNDMRQTAIVLVLVSGAVAFSLPYFWMIMTSLKPDDSIFRDPTSLQRVWVWNNYPKTFAFLENTIGHVRTGYGSLFVLNTLQVTCLGIAGTIFSCTMVAYAFGKLRWPGRDILFGVLLATMMLPGAVTMIPVYLIWNRLGFVDTQVPLWAQNLFGSAFYIFLLRQFFLGVPRELFEAARIDGCGFFGLFRRIALPLCRPALIIVFVFEMQASWSDLMKPLIYLQTEQYFTMPRGLKQIIDQFALSGEYHWEIAMAATLLATVPMIVIFAFAQRHLLDGLALSVKQG
jgi:multiple sugar transport system permease protein